MHLSHLCSLWTSYYPHSNLPKEKSFHIVGQCYAGLDPGTEMLVHRQESCYSELTKWYLLTLRLLLLEVLHPSQ